MNRLYKTIVVLLIGVLCVSAGMAETYNIDATHADIGFKIKHLGINNVRGNFSAFEGTIDYDGKTLDTLSIQMTIKASSIDTGIKKRDAHLRAADFFDVEKYPAITFETKSVHSHGNSVHLVGMFTMKEVSKEVELSAAVSGPVDSPFEEEVKVIGLHATTKLNRQDFGVSHDGTSDKLIGDVVHIEINIEAKK